MAWGIVLCFLVAVGPAWVWAAAPPGYRWPDARIDHLEMLLYQHFGVSGLEGSMGAFLTPEFCFGTQLGQAGRSIGAEWIRTAYHDMATANVPTGMGGIDASIGFETGRPENVGKAFNASLGQFGNAHSARSSMADLIALGAVLATGSCSRGAVLVPYRAGRVDATEPGPSGVPQPDEDLKTHIAKFVQQGFNVTEMIALVACGHSVGGVHGVDFPQIVKVVNDTSRDDNTQDFDGTSRTLDNTIASQFVGNISQNSLAFGQNGTTNSDFRIFNADGGDMITQMAADNDFFQSTCQRLLERMVNTVPKGITLTDVITPIDVKPGMLYGSVSDDGTVTYSGHIRHINLPGEDLFSNSRRVRLHFRPRIVGCSDSEPCAVAEALNDPSLFSGVFYGKGPFFHFYPFNSTVPASKGVSSFVVESVTHEGDQPVISDNGGDGFPWDDTLLPQIHNSSLSCIQNNADNSGTIKLTVAVREDSRFTNVSFVTIEPVAQPGSVVPKLVPVPVQMSKLRTVYGTDYSLYTGNFTSNPDIGDFVMQRSYDVVAEGLSGTVESKFHLWEHLQRCG